MNLKFKKLFDALRLYKFGLIRVSINKYFSDYFSYQTFIVYNFNLIQNEINSPSGKINIEKIDYPQGDLYRKFRKKFPAKEFVSRFNEQHQTCYVAVKDDEIAGYAWVAYKELIIDQIKYSHPLKNEELFIYSCYVSKEHRGEGIYPAMLRRILKDSRERKYRSALISVSSSNAGSIRGIEKTGFKKLNKIRYIKLLSKEVWNEIKNNEPEKITSGSGGNSGEN